MVKNNRFFGSIIAGVILTCGVSTVEARSHYGFGFSFGGPVYAPAPVYVAPPPPPVVYQPYYPVYPAPYYRPAPAFSFSYYGR